MSLLQAPMLYLWVTHHSITMYWCVTDPNAISVSLSPLNNYVLVGLAVKRLQWVFSPTQMVAQIYKLETKGAGEDSMKVPKSKCILYFILWSIMILLDIGLTGMIPVEKFDANFFPHFLSNASFTSRSTTSYLYWWKNPQVECNTNPSRLHSCCSFQISYSYLWLLQVFYWIVAEELLELGYKTHTNACKWLHRFFFINSTLKT